MGKTSSEAKNRYNEKAYDKILLAVPKGDKDRWKAMAEAEGKSLTQFVRDCVEKNN